MSTRLTNTTASRKAREALVRLLIHDGQVPPSLHRGRNAAANAQGINNNQNHRHRCPKNLGNPPQSSYSYQQLRAAYLQKIHAIHPDKVAHSSDESTKRSVEESIAGRNNTAISSREASKSGSHLRFIELQSAWESYEESMRFLKQLVGGSGPTGNGEENSNEDGRDREEEVWNSNFTMFGVGCSFADNPMERALRDEITDQACRGWFSAGSLSSDIGDNNDTKEGLKNGSAHWENRGCSLADDDMFIADDDLSSGEADRLKRTENVPSQGRRKSLVDLSSRI